MLELLFFLLFTILLNVCQSAFCSNPTTRLKNMIEKTSKLSSKKVAMIILDQTKPKKRKQVLIYSDNGFQTLNKKFILELFLPNFEVICSILFCQLYRTIARCRFIGKQVSHPAESNAHLNRQTQKTKKQKLSPQTIGSCVRFYKSF